MPFVKDFLFIAEPRPVGFTMFHFLFLFKHPMLSECAAALDERVHRAQEPNRTELPPIKKNIAMLSIWHCKSRIVWTNPCPVSLFLGENHNFHIVGTSMCSSYPYHIPIHQMVASFQTTIFGQTPTIQIH
jgi:hypothetical protein